MLARAWARYRPEGARHQVNGLEVPPGTLGSVRPDFTVGDNLAVEVKNYDIENNSAALVKIITDQTLERVTHLPENMVQNVIIDIRGQAVTPAQKSYIVDRVTARTMGALQSESIKFKGPGK